MRNLLNLFCFAIAFYLCSEGLNRWTEDRQADAANFRHYLRHRSEYDVVFAGSSVVHNMIDPREFDRTLAEHGYIVRSFNIGRAGCFAHETNYLLRRMLQPFADRPDFVFIDLYAFTPELGDSITVRDRIWHDLPESLAVLQSLYADSTIEFPRRVVLLRHHLRLTLERLFPLGRFHEEELAGPEDIELASLNQGYVPFDVLRERDGVIEMMNARFQNVPKEYNRLLTTRLAELDGSAEHAMRRVNPRANAAQLARLQRRGIVPVYVAAPSLREDPREARAIIREAGLPHVLLYDDPRDSPEYFQPDWRFDLHHLNDAASLDYTRRIALDFLRMAQADPKLACTPRRPQGAAFGRSA